MQAVGEGGPVGRGCGMRGFEVKVDGSSKCYPLSSWVYVSSSMLGSGSRSGLEAEGVGMVAGLLEA